MGKIGINMATGSLQKSETIVGIDLGTTNSLIAIVREDNKQAIALKEIDRLSLVPSVIYFDTYANPIVGTEAVKKLLSEPENTIYSAKRLMGKSYQDIANDSHLLAYKIHDNNSEELVKVQVKDAFYSPIELSSLILKELKNRAEHILKTPVNKAVITVPAYFNDTQRQATRDAGKLAGLDVLRIINEPTAASLAYGIGLKADEEKTIAVYDLGGGTFDLSILQLQNGICEVLATHGDTYLGGDDMDHAVMDYWTKQYPALQSPTYKPTLRVYAEQAKKHLSLYPAFETTFENYTLKITKQEFETLIDPLIQRSLECCKQALHDAQLSPEQIDEIVLVGGSTRVPYVKEAVKHFFKKEQLNDSLNPDEVVALGAAIQADILMGNNTDMLLLDVSPLSLGIETMGGLMDVLIPRNSKIPTKAARQYTTQKDGQSSMRIAVYQGERDLVKDNRNLASFHLKGIPAMPAGLAKVEISFLIDADGILRVQAKELRSGIQQSIEVSPKYGLSDQEMEQMLMDSLENAQSDIQSRALIEAQTEGKMLVETTEKFLQKNSSFLTAEEHQRTKEQLQILNGLLATTNKNEIQTATEQLNEITRPFAERLMDHAIKEAMAGKKI